MTAANISRWKFRLGSTASPPDFSPIEEAFSISGLGKTNQLIDVTNFDSPVGTMEYIAGLADGAEITIECNRIPNESPPTVQQELIAAVDAQESRAFQVAYIGVSPEETFDFEGVCLSWTVAPATTDKNTISFTVKISGDIIRA
jgi:hypothetical protein